jgi:putative peptide zinc metalloprotease protein
MDDYMNLSYKTNVKLSPLNIRKDKKNYIIEDLILGDFYEMPEPCIDAIEMINQSMPLGNIEDLLKDKYPQEEINIIDFISQLLELDLVSEIDGVELTKKIESETNDGYTGIPPGLGRFFFNKISVKLYMGLLAASIGFLIIKPNLFPQYQDLFVFDLMIENVAAWLIVTFLLVMLHEFGHVLAVRSEGLPARIELGHRLFFVVLETDMSQVWQLPAEKRNKLYLAGMYFDMVVLFIAITAQFFTSEGSILIGLLKLVLLDTFIRLVYQAAVFMKTDLYYVFENWTGCYNLMENGLNFLGKWLPFLKVSHTETFAGEEKFVRGYAIFYLAGILLTVAITAYYYIPQFIFAINQIMLPGLTEPFNSLRFWDSVVFLLQIVLVAGLLIYSWSKKYRLSS